MSSGFDIVQRALMTLSKQENLTNDQKAVVEAVERTIADWHELNHKQRDVINLKTRPGYLVGVVDTERMLLNPAEYAKSSVHGLSSYYIEQ